MFSFIKKGLGAVHHQWRRLHFEHDRVWMWIFLKCAAKPTTVYLLQEDIHGKRCDVSWQHIATGFLFAWFVLPQFSIVNSVSVILLLIYSLFYFPVLAGGGWWELLLLMLLSCSLKYHLCVLEHQTTFLCPFVLFFWKIRKKKEIGEVSLFGLSLPTSDMKHCAKPWTLLSLWDKRQNERLFLPSSWRRCTRSCHWGDTVRRGAGRGLPACRPGQGEVRRLWRTPAGGRPPSSNLFSPVNGVQHVRTHERCFFASFLLVWGD